MERIITCHFCLTNRIGNSLSLLLKPGFWENWVFSEKNNTTNNIFNRGKITHNKNLCGRVKLFSASKNKKIILRTFGKVSSGFKYFLKTFVLLYLSWPFHCSGCMQNLMFYRLVTDSMGAKVAEQKPRVSAEKPYKIHDFDSNSSRHSLDIINYTDQHRRTILFSIDWWQIQGGLGAKPWGKTM